MARKLQVKRGLTANLPTLSEGEFGFCTDTSALYIGSGSGNVQLANNLSLADKLELAVKKSVGVTAAGWSGTEAPYTQRVSCNGILASDVVLYNVGVSTTNYETAQNQLAAFAAIYTMDINDNEVTFYATEKPTLTIFVQIYAFR